MKEIVEYHAHIYFCTSPKSILAANQLAEKINNRFKVKVGKLNFKLVGPHTQPMFRVLFSKDQFSEFIQWLIFERGNLNILIHPVTGDSYLDHVEYGLWLGEKLAMKVDKMDYSLMKKNKVREYCNHCC